MRGLFTKKSLTIEAGQAVSGVSKHAHTLRIASGRVWITVEGISHDYWLTTGDTLTVIPGRLVVIEADRTASRIDIPPPKYQAVLIGLGARLGNAMQRLMSSKTVAITLERCMVPPAPAQCKNCG